jgi:hypothetical protein
MTLEQLKTVKESLEECGPNVEDFDWGPSYELAKQRRRKALKILETAIAIAGSMPG